MYAMQITIPGIEYETTLCDIVILFAFATGVHYNAENIYASLVAAEDKAYALGCILPYA